jgi:GT2 family glycosyltransferase
MAPSVSLIVLNWNGRRHLTACLDSLALLDYPKDRLEVVVVDNGSRDGSADLVRSRYPSVKLIELDRNRGFAEPNNLAAEAAGGEWLGFLNNDMRVEPSWLHDLLATLAAHPEASCLASRIKTWDGAALDFIGGGVSLTGHGFQLGMGESESSLDVERPILFPCGGAMLVRRPVYQELGGFDGDYFAYFEDVDLGWRMNLLGHEVWYTPRATAFHRHHATGGRLPAAKLRMLYERNALYTIYKCFDDDNLAAALPAAMLLLNERALVMAGVDPAGFRLGPAPADREANAGAQVAQRLYAYDPAEALGESLPARARRVLSEEGLGPALRKTRRYLRERTEAGLRRTVRLPGSRALPTVALSHSVALSEFGHSLEKLNVKRAWLQQRRRRSDAELLPLLCDPFYVNYRHPRYERFFTWLVRVHGLDRRLGGVPD